MEKSFDLTEENVIVTTEIPGGYVQIELKDKLADSEGLDKLLEDIRKIASEALEKFATTT